MSHISRKELKKDEIREGIVHSAEAALAHQKQIWLYGGVVLFAILAIFGWRFYSQRETVKASAAFDEAAKVFNARIRMPSEPEPQGEVTYLDDNTKYTEAAKKFEEVANQHSRTRPGQMAQYYVGLCYERLQQNNQALEWFTKVQSAGDAELASLARMRTAHIYELTGKTDDAVKLYQEIIAKPTTMVPKPLAMLALGDLQLRTNPAEAEKTFQQIRAEFPDSEVSREAQERIDSLPPKS